jgi:N-dimethylarginine dimethylaminohydrolase
MKPKTEQVAALAVSEPVKTFLMCRPTHYGVHYSINPWMNPKLRVNAVLANDQWNNLCERILEHGGAIRHIKERPGLPDMVFTANGGLVLKDKAKCVVVAHFRHEERKGEEEWFVQWFSDEGWHFTYPSAPHEGAGDALMYNGTLVSGTGFRSDPVAHAEIEQFWGGKVLQVKLVDPNFYHLDTCFCPLADGDYLIFPAAFDRDSFQAIEMLQRETPEAHGMVVPTDEALKFACNAVLIDRTVILPSGCQQTMDLLRGRGYNPVPVDMTEFIKAGGACKCLTLEL